MPRATMSRRAALRTAALAGAALLASACELQETTIAEPEPFVVVETYLIAGRPIRVALHASAGGAERIEPDAVVRLIGADFDVRLGRTDPLDCLAPGFGIDPRDFPGGLACYFDSPDSIVEVRPEIVPGGLYQLGVELPDGTSLAGATRVPEPVAFSSDAGAIDPCRLEPWTQLELSWNLVPGAAAYVIDLRAFGVEEALAREGIEADVPDPLALRGLAVGNADTTIVLPAEFGLFDRFSLDGALALALQRGVPEGVAFDVTVAAVDQNFVDWVRGGDFNPSGLIRAPSMFGEGGTGVIASMTVDVFSGTTEQEQGEAAPCGS